MDGFSGHFMPETMFLCRLNLLYVIHACWIFCVVILASKKKNWKKIPVCVCFYSCLNSMLFLERNVDISMHAIRLNLLENVMDAGFLCTTVYYLENWKEFPVCMCRVLV